MREQFASDLAKDVLGPRGGANEILTASPLTEYITGVLAPVTEETQQDIDSAAELPVDEAPSTAEDDRTDEDVSFPGLFSPVLDPQSRPHSCGLTFGVNSSPSQEPRISLCVSWARYKGMETEDSYAWTRSPRVAVLNDIDASDSVFYLTADGQTTASKKEAEVSVHLQCRQRETGEYLLTVLLVNQIDVPSGENLKADFHIFQPQIRVTTGDHTEVVPGFEQEPTSQEDRRLKFLYRNRPVLAKGHLCSAVWRSIDPERPYTNESLDFPSCKSQPPFYWVDGDEVSASVRETYSPPDVRTEFLPLYSVSSPELDLPAQFDYGPTLSANELAEAFRPADLRNALEPLVDGYSDWINGLVDDLHDVSPEERDVAIDLIDRCEVAASRMAEGLNLLCQDEEVRLSFCFAMKAIAIQAQWPVTEESSPISWRPFQMAFVLLSLSSIALDDHPDRDICDLLWVPTGAGKTEAYLALAAFTLAYRRRRAKGSDYPTDDATGAGTAVISRYTLRLLTIQQFRRTLRMITACELLRVHRDEHPKQIGWSPLGTTFEGFVWGTPRFSAGLWVGGGVTPNRLRDSWSGTEELPGALTALANADAQAQGEPAQVLNCPACNSVLAVPDRDHGGLTGERHEIQLLVRGDIQQPLPEVSLPSEGLEIDSLTLTETNTRQIHRLTVGFRCEEGSILTAEDVDRLWSRLAPDLENPGLLPARASRPGYFLRGYLSSSGTQKVTDFEIFCPSENCPLNRSWCEALPSGWCHGTRPSRNAPRGDVGDIPRINNGCRLVRSHNAFEGQHPFVSSKIPIPAYTVDDQVYQRVPSVVISTVDKFARPPFEPRAAALFGNVSHHHSIWGFYRPHLRPSGVSVNSGGHPIPGGTQGDRHYRAVPSLAPPDLILQDELHLIEGPLGSLVGLYETAVEELAREPSRGPVKYISSTATVRRAEEQVQAVFNRSLRTFPPPGLDARNSFFVRFEDHHPLDDQGPGQLYFGIAAPGRGPMTPTVRIWARLLQSAYRHRDHKKVDPFWTLAGYFNAIRELGGARALYRQDIPGRLRTIADTEDPRPLPEDRSQELSSRMDSTRLPTVLDLLNLPKQQDSMFSTSMFGTGVDIPRLSLMVVHGQPKTTSSYIQATGRVGRRTGAIVPVFLRATRPRDLNHYEFFCGYHMQLQRFVEPVTVMPFAPGALDRGCGPVGAFLLRNSRNNSHRWYLEDDAVEMARRRSNAPEVQWIRSALINRAGRQPDTRAPSMPSVMRQVEASLDEWAQVATRVAPQLQYVEYAIQNPPTTNVVLGDPQHQHEASLEVVYENAPQSLREIEEQCGFEI